MLILTSLHGLDFPSVIIGLIESKRTTPHKRAFSMPPLSERQIHRQVLFAVHITVLSVTLYSIQLNAEDICEQKGRDVG
jgi:hypothetical protein